MKNKKTKLFVILNTLIMLCLITFSFAWIYELNNPNGTFIKLIFGTEKNNPLKVANDDIDVSLYIGDEDNNYTLMSSTENPSNNKLCVVENAAPGQVMRYSLKIDNKSSMPSKVTISFTGISCDDVLLDSIYMGLYAAIGFDENYAEVAPKVDDFNMRSKEAELLNNSSFKFIENVTLPANKSDIELRFYIRIDHTAGNEAMKSKFSIDTVNFIVL